MLFRRKRKMTPPLERAPDDKPFQVYEIVEKKEKEKRKQRYEKSRFVSPIFGKNVKDEVVIPIKTDQRRDLDKLDAFRTKPRLTKEERIRKYGTAYPEFDLVRGKDLDEVHRSMSKEKSNTKIVEASIIDNTKTPTDSGNEHHNEGAESSYDQPSERAETHGDQQNGRKKSNMYDFLSDDEPDRPAPTENKAVQDEMDEEPPMPEAVPAKPDTGHEEPDNENEPDEKITETHVPATDKTNETVKAGAKTYEDYQIPPISLLKKPSDEPVDLSASIESQINRLNETFKEFGVGARVFTHTQGPTVTRYEIAVEKGVKLNKITNLTDNLKMVLEAREIRIEAPIPGKKTVGIEVPNEKAETVHFVDIVNRSMFKNAAMPLTIALGLDIDGNPIYAPIKSMPHGLIAGQTGSGKSVCINTVLMSLLLKYKPSELKLVLIDPKMVELSGYNDIPHLITPVINDPKAATAALNWVVDEMERRFQTFRNTQSRDIDAYNKKTENDEEKLPYLVIVVDELADLMMVSSQYVEESIMRITQKARACGIHLIVATQRPSTDVIKGTIKSNIPTRIAFSVASHIDSQTIIDSAGAETLLGRGDMLYAPSGHTKQRLQGAFVNDEDIETVMEFIKSQAPADYLFNEEALVKSATKTFEYDELLEDVGRFVVTKQEASINKISKTFSIGFNRAQSIVESLESAGVVSANMGSRAREVLVDMDELESIFDNMG